MNLQPLEDRIVVRPGEAEETTVSGLVIPDTAKEKPQQGEVLAVGPGPPLRADRRASSPSTSPSATSSCTRSTAAPRSPSTARTSWSSPSRDVLAKVDQREEEVVIDSPRPGAVRGRPPGRSRGQPDSGAGSPAPWARASCCRRRHAHVWPRSRARRVRRCRRPEPLPPRRARPASAGRGARSRCSRRTARPGWCSPSGPRRCRRTRARSRSPAASSTPPSTPTLACRGAARGATRRSASRPTPSSRGASSTSVGTVVRPVHDGALRRSARRRGRRCVPTQREVDRVFDVALVGAARRRRVPRGALDIAGRCSAPRLDRLIALLRVSRTRRSGARPRASSPGFYASRRLLAPAVRRDGAARDRPGRKSPAG